MNARICEKLRSDPREKVVIQGQSSPIEKPQSGLTGQTVICIRKAKCFKCLTDLKRLSMANSVIWRFVKKNLN